MTVLISIPVHERPEVVLDQLENIRKFCPNSRVILHMNPTFVDRFEIDEYAEKNEFVLVNPFRSETEWANLIQTHLINFRYAESIGLKFSHFAMHASNDMFVKAGMEEYVLSNVAGFQAIPTYPDMQWTPRRRAEHDPHLQAILSDIGQNNIFASQIEGTFYERSLFSRIVDVIERHFRQNEICRYMTKNDGDTNNTLYAREEIYFSTIADRVFPWASLRQPAFPYVYNEVWTKVAITPEVIEQIILNKVPEETCWEQRFATPHIGLYLPNHLYCVKRVARVYDDPVREFIRGINATPKP